MYKGFIQNGYPYLSITIENHPVKAIIDTGFNGELMLPETMIKKLNLNCIGDEIFSTASGDIINTSFYFANLKWFNRDIKVGVLSTKGDSALLGMGLIFLHTLLVTPLENKVEIY